MDCKWRGCDGKQMLFTTWDPDTNTDNWHTTRCTKCGRYAPKDGDQDTVLLTPTPKINQDEMEKAFGKNWMKELSY